MNEDQQYSPRTFLVNNETQPLNELRKRVRQILQEAGQVPPESFFLIEFGPGSEERRFTDLDQEIDLHENQRFAAVYRGSTPVS